MKPIESFLDATARVRIIDAILENLHERDVFPEVAQAMEHAIKQRLVAANMRH